MFLFYNCFIGFAEMNWTGLGVLWSAYALAKASVRRPQRVIEKKLMPTSKKRAEPFGTQKFPLASLSSCTSAPTKVGGSTAVEFAPTTPTSREVELKFYCVQFMSLEKVENLAPCPCKCSVLNFSQV